ncbi:MAG: hypothetical protein ACHQO8_10940 [Vicinamibacterales bacterium]
MTLGLLAIALPAAAETPTFLEARTEPTLHGRVMSEVSFLSAPPVGAPVRFDAAQAAAQATPSQRPVVFEYSEGYQTRLKIHKIASFATIPLFVTEGFLGASLYNNPTPGKRSAHLWVATGMGVLFGINGVTGVWNLTEARKDPNGSMRRWVHSVLMLAADAAFFATAVTGPGHRELERNFNKYESSRSLHRSLAFASVTLASVGYGIMLFPHH